MGRAPFTLDAALAFPPLDAVMSAVNDSDGDEFFSGVEEYVAWRGANPGAPLADHFKAFTSWIQGDFGYGTVKDYLSVERVSELEVGEESFAMLIDIAIVASSLAHLAAEGTFPEEQWKLVSPVLDRQCDPRVDSYFGADGSRREAMLAAKAALAAAVR